MNQYCVQTLSCQVSGILRQLLPLSSSLTSFLPSYLSIEPNCPSLIANLITACAFHLLTERSPMAQLMFYAPLATYEVVFKNFRTESITKYTLTFGITRCSPLQRIMEAKLSSLIHKMATQLHLVAKSCKL